jgi:transketolase
MDAVQAANSGHPGTPMALAPVAYCLWQQLLRFDPQDPIWPNRDRFILSAGHASMLLCLEAHERLKAEGTKSRVVSMPSWELFDDQPREYRESVLPPEVKARVSVEQASTFGWAKYVGATGQSLGMHSFGASAPLKELTKKFGFTPEHVVAAAKEQLE